MGGGSRLIDVPSTSHTDRHYPHKSRADDFRQVAGEDLDSEHRQDALHKVPKDLAYPFMSQARASASFAK